MFYNSCSFNRDKQETNLNQEWFNGTLKQSDVLILQTFVSLSKGLIFLLMQYI